MPRYFVAIRLWRAAHPVVLGSSGAGLAPKMLMTMIFCVLTFTLFYVALLTTRVRIEKADDSIQRLKRL